MPTRCCDRFYDMRRVGGAWRTSARGNRRFLRIEKSESGEVLCQKEVSVKRLPRSQEAHALAGPFSTRLPAAYCFLRPRQTYHFSARNCVLSSSKCLLLLDLLGCASSFAQWRMNGILLCAYPLQIFPQSFSSASLFSQYLTTTSCIISSSPLAIPPAHMLFAALLGVTPCHAQQGLTFRATHPQPKRTHQARSCFSKMRNSNTHVESTTCSKRNAEEQVPKPENTEIIQDLSQNCSRKNGYG